MLHVLIVEADPAAAVNLARLLEHHDGFRVVGFADDLRSALQIARSANVHVAFVDVQLACLDTGFQVAHELNRRGIACVLSSGTSSPFPMPELAVTWLEKPYTLESVSASLGMAADGLMAQVKFSPPPTEGGHYC